jgi:tRNA1Val (adenine37-N6)-methyltransferase
MFRFKQFSVDQTNCAMKINTDGVLLGAVANHKNPQRILDIGAGTGVIALMLAQKFNNARIDAVEIDTLAAETAGRNFENSIFYEQLHIHSISINDYFDAHLHETFDLIISNPPFYINSLQSPEKTKKLAKHTDVNFFEALIKGISTHLSKDGLCWLILPIETSVQVKVLINQNGMYLQKMINIRSYKHSAPHREIVCLGFDDKPAFFGELVIYQSAGVYTEEYKEVLKPYFIAF